MTVDDRYRLAGEVIAKTGGTPLPVNDTLVRILKYFIMEDEVDFIAAFSDQKSQTMEQLKLSSRLPEAAILEKVNALSKRGVIFNQPNSKGVAVYRLLPLINVGTFEYNFMGKVEMTDRNREISALFESLFDDLRSSLQRDYDVMVPLLLKDPPLDRTVPVLRNGPNDTRVKIVINQDLGLGVERVVPTQEVEALIQKFDEIALGHCFCRHHMDLRGTPCKQTKDRESCFTFGKSARFTSEQGFSRLITKDEAIAVLRKAEEDGLVHKAYHPNFDTSKDETSICNCCKCCCGNLIPNMKAPIINSTNYLAEVDADTCIGCGTCVEKCPTEAVFLGDDQKAHRTEELCFGCGVCAYFCPVDARSLVEGERIVRIPPRRRQPTA